MPSESACAGSVVGTVEYGLGDTGNPPECGGNWHASKAEDPVFEVNERITFGNCPDGTVRLELDTQSGTLAYDFTPESGPFAAEGTLMRGTDPGSLP